MSAEEESLIFKRQLGVNNLSNFLTISATFAVSAFWHGFYPSYYTTFFIMWSQLEFGRAFFRAKDKLKLNKYLYAAID